jgi:FAD/FMN-containing dehydrogenase
MEQLNDFLSKNTHIHYANPQSPDYAELRPGFVLNVDEVPALIVRPRSAEDIARLLTVLTANNLPFSVRGGGHDMYGRSQIHGGITIDMREISHVEVDRENLTAQVGGGVIIMSLLKALDAHGVTTPHGITPTVGYTGWAIHGGYGLLSATCGMGADQILGAKVIDAKGRIIDADETMLTGIRGGGGGFGIIYELKIKVYAMDQVGFSKDLGGYEPDEHEGTSRSHHISAG